MNKLMRILFLTSRLPYPPYRGDKLKIFNIIKILSRKHTIHLCSFVQSVKEQKYVSCLNEYCESIETIVIPPYRSYWNCIKNVFDKEPFQNAYFKSPMMIKAINKILVERNIDIIHTHLIRMAQYTENIPIPKILDLTDAVSLYIQRMAGVLRNPLKRLFFFEEYSRLKKYENILRKFDTCLVCSEKDKEALKESNPSAKIDILYNGIDIDYFTPLLEAKPAEKAIIYTGNMSYWPNIDGIIYFYSKIFPLIRKEMPEVKLYVVGQNPPLKVRKLKRDSQVVITGLVEDIRQFYKKTMVSVCPIRFKGGTLNKILEPLSIGLPVVATSISAEGLDITPGKEILIADDPDEFAKKVIYLMKNKEVRTTLSIYGRKAVEKYSWSKIVAELEMTYADVINQT